MLIDLRPKGLGGKGKQLQNAMDKANITLNKNSVPFQKASPFNPSGLRLGTPAVTTRGMKEDEMRFIAKCVAKVIDDYKDKPLLEKIRKEIMEMVGAFPIYPDFTILE
jgi:glycine hydroxymethyltransferase